MNKELASSPERYIRPRGFGGQTSTIEDRIKSKKKQLTELQQEFEEIVATLEYDKSKSIFFPLLNNFPESLLK